MTKITYPVRNLFSNGVKNSFKKFLLSFLILVLAFAWVFGYPPVYENFWRVIIWENPSIPPKIQEARAENLSLYVDSFDLSSDLWTDVGASPYLTAQDEPTNYIYRICRYEGGIGWSRH